MPLECCSVAPGYIVAVETPCQAPRRPAIEYGPLLVHPSGSIGRVPWVLGAALRVGHVRGARVVRQPVKDRRHIRNWTARDGRPQCVGIGLWGIALIPLAHVVDIELVLAASSEQPA